MIGDRNLVDRGRVARLDHGALAHIAEKGELPALGSGDLPIRAAQQDVGLDADRAQLGDGMLRRFRLQLAGARNIGEKRQVDVDRLAALEIIAELANGLEEGQALDVADRATDLDQHEIEALVAGEHELLDGVGHMGDHLDGGAEIIAAPLLGDDVLIDAPGRDVVVLGRGASRETFVMAKVEIGLGAVIGDENLAMLIGRHRARIDIEVGVELAEPDRIAARLKQRAERRRSETLAEGGDHAAGDEDVPRHGI